MDRDGCSQGSWKEYSGLERVEKLTGEPAERLLKEGPFARDSGWR